MRKYYLPVLSISVLLSFCGPTGALEPITDANSVHRLVQKIQTLPAGGLIHLTFKSKIDQSLQPLLAKLPQGYTQTQTWPLLVVLHGLGDGPIVVPSIDSMVQIGPFGRGDLWYRGVGEQDVLECIDLAKQIFGIDPEKIYLCGFSMGGAGTFDLGLKYPDIWAACVPVCGTMSRLDWVANGGNLPFWINTGSEDKVIPAPDAKRAYEKALELGFDHWKYTEYQGMGHSFWIDWGQIEKWLLSHKKVKKPPRISFTCEKTARAYWVEIAERLDGQRPARIDAEIASQTITVKTANIGDYTLYLQEAPVSLSQEITVRENGQPVFEGLLPANGTFSRTLNGRRAVGACTE